MPTQIRKKGKATKIYEQVLEKPKDWGKLSPKEKEINKKLNSRKFSTMK